MYEVKSCVCDYAIYDEGKLIKDLIFNSRKNAELVCDVMNLDCNHKEYGRLQTVSIDIKNSDVMKKVVSKIIKNIEEKNGISKYNEELLSELVGKDFKSKIAFRFNKLNEYNVKIKCTCCNKETLCREDVIEIEEGQKLLFFCRDCDKDIQDILDSYND